MAKIVGLHQIARNLIPSAFALMEKEYVKPNRVKLTHFWLAKNLGTSNLIAFHLLQKMAKMRILCLQTPAGPIFWDNESLTVGRALELLEPKANEHHAKQSSTEAAN